MTEIRLTPQRAFRQIILDELRRHGGVATPTLVYSAVERSGMLLPGDFDLVFGGEARWKNAVRQEARDEKRRRPGEVCETRKVATCSAVTQPTGI